MKTLICGDLFDVLPTLDAESFDACVTDPPYGLGFMAKDWDVPGGIGASRQESPRRSADASLQKRQNRGAQAMQAETEQWAREVFRVLKPGAHLVAFGGTRMYHRLTAGIEDAGFEIRDCLTWLYGSGFPKSLNVGNGQGTALKPAWEPIVLARKPTIGTVAANILQHSTGALNIDLCRIETTARPLRVLDAKRTNNSVYAGRVTGDETFMGGSKAAGDTDLGRWPANVCLDEGAAAMLDEQSGELISGAEPSRRRADKFQQVFGAFKGEATCTPARGASIGGASRFFYVAKASRDEREYGTEGLTARQRDDSRKDGQPGGDNPRNRGLHLRGNFHPTVKPIELMRWLVKLVVPLNGVCLDPFTGSGTTGMACAYELRQFIGIEREPEYVELARRRIAAVAPLFEHL